MKNFTLTFLMLALGIIGIHTSASAQLSPLTHNVSGLRDLSHEITIDTTSEAPVPIQDKTIISSLTVDDLAVAKLNRADLSPVAKTGLVNNLNTSNDFSILSTIVPMKPQPILTLIPDGTSTSDTGSPADLSGSNGSVSNGSGSNNPSYYQQPAPVAHPIVSNVSPIYTYVPSDTAPVKKVSTKKVAVSSDHESDIVSTPSDRYENRSSYGASTYSVGTSINLVGILLIILGIVTLVVVAGEYQHRKQKEALARAAAYHEHVMA